jgi:hypothetical protein
VRAGTVHPDDHVVGQLGRRSAGCAASLIRIPNP